jgi:hypothetical protein
MPQNYKDRMMKKIAKWLPLIFSVISLAACTDQTTNENVQTAFVTSVTGLDSPAIVTQSPVSVVAVKSQPAATIRDSDIVGRHSPE